MTKRKKKKKKQSWTSTRKKKMRRMVVAAHLGINVTQEMYDQLTAASIDEDRSVSAVCRRAIKLYLAGKKEEN